MRIDNMRTAEQSLYNISDTVQVPVSIIDGVVQGSRKAVYQFLEDVGMPFTMTAVAYFRGVQDGVLFHVAGNLYLMVSHYYSTGSTSIYIIDQAKSKVPMKNLIDPKGTLRDVVDEIRHCIIKVFHHRDRKWHPLTLPPA